MVESPDFIDPVLGIPTFSLYGTVRRLSAPMLDCFDVLLVDLQDVGCRIYTFTTTLRYVLEQAAEGSRPCGCWTAPIPRVDRWKGYACEQAGRVSSAPGHADASRSDTRRARALVRAHAPSSTSTAA